MVGISLFESLYSSRPYYSSHLAFGSICFILLLSLEPMKLSTCSQMRVFLGYGITQKNYHFYHPTSNHLLARHVIFLEHIRYFLIPLSSPSLSPPIMIPNLLTPFLTLFAHVHCLTYALCHPLLI